MSSSAEGAVLVEKAKQAACIQAVDDHVTRDTCILGIGSGSTIPYCVARIAERWRAEGLPLRACIPTSFQAQALILEAGLPLGTLNQYPRVDVAFDGADEVEGSGLHCIKGGGGCLWEEKLVAFSARSLVLLADYRKESAMLGRQWTRGLPVEVVPSAYVATQQTIARTLGGKPTLRMGVCKAGPVVTDHGNFLLDVDFGEMPDPRTLHARLIAIPGVVETGLFCDMAAHAYLGMADGSVKVLTRPVA